ncbi:MAG TPA: tyrosine-type recombinase/integrase [Pyrinomonadaceae bacterium]|jgi:integrase/recombinase XerD|nr:tyrosine-type recombinase/integrase [Pyrinomonadaceae bacterium]
MMKELFAEFLKEKRYLCNLSPKTLDSYQQAFNCYVRLGCGTPTKDGLKDFVVNMRESGLSAGGCNVYIRSINSFLSWLLESGHIPEPLKIKQLPKPRTVIKVFSEQHVQALLKFRPRTQYEWRLHALICLLIDSGTRIDEVLGAKVSGMDLEQLFIKVLGKGSKERWVPISIEMRKILWLYTTRHRFKVGDFLFPTKTGGRLEYHNVLRDLKTLCDDLGIEGVRLSPHGFRHFYSVNFLRRGGDLYRLSKILGHTSVKTTEIYLQSMGVEMVQEIHQQLSPLSRY